MALGVLWEGGKSDQDGYGPGCAYFQDEIARHSSDLEKYRHFRFPIGYRFWLRRIGCVSEAVGRR